ncbi:hypothetical protein [Pinibacter soli]|uniref:DUF5362 domain-containing protein n=1 Tax=Pinibacter soli TaxID=3044211 RepID=A0ABT6RI62_9BACT|nr:hypothetical protein [Pinibacter soli]MDI3322240.1 hypothetical protein [Pinibacter soli]
MENVETSLLDVNLTIDTQSDRSLRETAKWNKFLAIIGFIFGGFFILAGVFAIAGSSFSASTEAIFAFGSGIGAVIVFLVFAVLSILPNIFRYRFASQVIQALDTNDQVTLSSSLNNLKIFYRFYGIIMIVMIAFYALAIFFAFLGRSRGY